MYNYKRKAITAAKDLFYPKSVISRLQKAETENEIARILHTAREASA
jgi:plasmid stabilization system protein ParE